MSMLRQTVNLCFPCVIIKSLIHVLFVVLYCALATAQVVSYIISVVQNIILALQIKRLILVLNWTDYVFSWAKRLWIWHIHILDISKILEWADPVGDLRSELTHNFVLVLHIDSHGVTTRHSLLRFTKVGGLRNFTHGVTSTVLIFQINYIMALYSRRPNLCLGSIANSFCFSQI